MQRNELSKKFIIVIEDEKSIADLICYSLGKEGIRTEAFETGKDGLNWIKENDFPDLIVLDVMLPDIDGFEVCKEITSNYKIPVILLTAKSNIIDKIKGLEIGADDYITKPFDILELSARIRTVLRRLDNYNEQDIVRVSHNVVIHVEERKVLKKGKKLDLTRNAFDKGNFVEVIVRDNGVGIPEDKLDKIFEPFYKVDTKKAKEQGGSGLGLSIAKKIVNNHTGNITVDSKINEGTTVTVTLPKK